MNYPSGHEERRKKQHVKVNRGNNSQVKFFSLNNSKVKLMCSQAVHLCVDCFANPAGQCS